MHEVNHNVVGVWDHFSHPIILTLSIQFMLFTIQKFMPTSLYLDTKKGPEGPFLVYSVFRYINR